MEFLEHLICPITKNGLHQIHSSDFSKHNIPSFFKNLGEIKSGLLDTSKQYFYPVFNDIIILHKHYALYLGKGAGQQTGLSHNKQRVFDYYNQINYRVQDELQVYNDTGKWVDYRDISSAYIKKSFTRSANHLPATGKYLLDIASGPIGLPEYMNLGKGYEWRICVDISVNALLQAKRNIEHNKGKAVFICGDITNIPIKDRVCDAVLSQHTLYHVPKNDQLQAVNEMYRVAKPNSKIVIIYCWFYHSWLMNLGLNVVQLYRIARHLTGKFYVRFFNSKPRLYFYTHSPAWFKTSFKFSKQIEFYCWRSTNKYFLTMYVHRLLGGKYLLNKLQYWEEKHNKFLGKYGEYPAIVITKTE